MRNLSIEDALYTRRTVDEIIDDDASAIVDGRYQRNKCPVNVYDVARHLGVTLDEISSIEWIRKYDGTIASVTVNLDSKHNIAAKTTTTKSKSAKAYKDLHADVVDTPDCDNTSSNQNIDKTMFRDAMHNLVDELARKIAKYCKEGTCNEYILADASSAHCHCGDAIQTNSDCCDYAKYGTFNV